MINYIPPVLNNLDDFDYCAGIIEEDLRHVGSLGTSWEFGDVTFRRVPGGWRHSTSRRAIAHRAMATAYIHYLKGQQERAMISGETSEVLTYGGVYNLPQGTRIRRVSEPDWWTMVYEEDGRWLRTAGINGRKMVAEFAGIPVIVRGDLPQQEETDAKSEETPREDAYFYALADAWGALLNRPVSHREAASMVLILRAFGEVDAAEALRMIEGP